MGLFEDGTLPSVVVALAAILAGVALILSARGVAVDQTTGSS